jgi:hypothetical protein
MQIDTSKISKTTVNGALGLFIVALLTLNFDAKGHLVMTAQQWVAVVLAVARGAVSYLQKDAQ